MATHPVAAQDAPTTTSKAAPVVQEITVTAERRSQNQQKVPASIVVVRGADLLAHGQITTAQILETVPNVVVQAANVSGQPSDNPNGNITLRGVQTTQSTGGTPAPSATATYVDDVYQGIGGDFDIDRVEVLLGPQGTLYGRSATGGVVAFNTVDPVLGRYTGNISGEYGTADLRQAIFGVNIPIGDQIAVRLSGREYDQNDYYRGNAGAVEDQELRAKVLYQPTADLKIHASWTIDEHHNNAGGIASTLSAPNTFDFDGVYDKVYSIESRRHQYTGGFNYNFGFGNLTYIGALHDFTTNFSTPPFAFMGGSQNHKTLTPLDQFHTEEIRIASNPGSKLTWIVGGSYYSNLFDTSGTAVQFSGATNTGAPDPNDASIYDAPIYTNATKGRTFDYGVFTEETYPILSNLRITGGARFDRTVVDKTVGYIFNANLDEYQNSINPANNLTFQNTSRLTFTNFTYKLRAEYDVTPRNLVYAMGSSGFLPGDQQLSPQAQFTPPPNFAITGVNFLLLPFNQERLTAWEIGSKNRFFGNSLQINLAAYYYDYAGYQEAANTSSFGPPIFTVLSVPVRNVGGEIEAVWRATATDRLSLDLGLTDAEITGFPHVAGTTHDASYYLASSRLPNVPLLQMTAMYDHTFEFANGSTIVPRAQVRYISSQYLNTYTQIEGGYGEAPYLHQAGLPLVDLGFTWTSPRGKFSATGYVRNLFDETYKLVAAPTTQGLFDIEATPGQPRTFGVVLAARF